MYFTEIECIDTISVTLKKCYPFKSSAPLHADQIPIFFIPKLHNDLTEILLDFIKTPLSIYMTRSHH